MFRLPASGKIILAAAAVAASIAAVQPAAAQPYRWGPHPGWVHHDGWRRPVFVAPHRCFVRRTFVSTPYGPRPTLLSLSESASLCGLQPAAQLSETRNQRFSSVDRLRLIRESAVFTMQDQP